MHHELLNRGLWIAGLLLQCALLIALVARQEARRFPAFTLLIGFYTVRATLLYALSGHIASPTYGVLYDGLSLVDLLLQVTVAAEIARHIVRQRGGWSRRFAGVFILFFGLAAGAGWLAGDMLHAYPRISVDRGEVFTSCLMMLLFAWALWSRASGPVRYIVEGFALYGLVSVISQVGRALAMVHRSALSYVAWSYTPVGVYLLVVMFWLWAVRMGGERDRHR